MSGHRRIPLICAAVALGTAGSAVGASLAARGWHASALVRMSDAGQDQRIAAIARRHDPGFEFVPITSHYDGVYFYAVALDPLGRGEAARAIEADRGPYRYGHPGYGWMTWLASFGRGSAVPVAMTVLALLGAATGAAAASALARRLGLSPWAGLAVAFNPGIIYATSVLTSEAVGVALLMLGLLAWVRERRVLAAVVLALACLTKEPFLLVPAALGGWELIRGLRSRGSAWLRAPELWRRAGLLVAGPAVFAVWYAYLIAHFDVIPLSLVGDLTQWPFTGWVDSIRRAADLGLNRNASFDVAQIATASIPLLVGTGGVLLAGLVAGARFRTEISGVYCLLALVAFSLSWLGVLYPKDLIREVSMPVALLPFAFARRPIVSEPGREPPWSADG